MENKNRGNEVGGGERTREILKIKLSNLPFGARSQLRSMYSMWLKCPKSYTNNAQKHAE